MWIAGPPALDIQLCCQREAERCTTASWRFNINGQTALLFDAMNMTWTIMNPGARGIKEEWEDKGLAGYFRRISTGDCNHWLRKFLEHWEKVLEPPGKEQGEEVAVALLKGQMPSFPGGIGVCVCN